MALGVGAIVKSVAGLGQTWLEGKVAKTKAKAEAEAAVMVKQAESVADWETAMARSSQQSWKDEWLTKVALKDMASVSEEKGLIRTTLYIISPALNSSNQRSKLYQPVHKHLFRQK